MKTKKIPMRTCLGCSEERPKAEMLRVVRSPEGEISLDFTGKKSGRGAYICPKAECLKKARRAKRIEHALSCPVEAAVYDALEAEMADRSEDESGK